MKNGTSWIPVTVRLPENDEMVLVSCRTAKGVNTVNRAYYMNGSWHGSGSMSSVKAWMPLPEPFETEFKDPDPEDLDVDSCFGKLSALHFEVLKMNLQLDFIEDFNLAQSLKEKIKCMDELIESLEDDIWICESLICAIDEEVENEQ